MAKLKGCSLVCFTVSKVLIVSVCLVLFLAQMKDEWTKFHSKITSINFRFRNDNAKEKLLPCLTFCPVPGFKVSFR